VDRLGEGSCTRDLALYLDSMRKFSRQRRSDSRPGFDLAQHIAVYGVTFSVMESGVDRDLIDSDRVTRAQRRRVRLRGLLQDRVLWCQIGASVFLPTASRACFSLRCPRHSRVDGPLSLPARC